MYVTLDCVYVFHVEYVCDTTNMRHRNFDFRVRMVSFLVATPHEPNIFTFF